MLKVIDPTLIEEKGHIFLTIISSVAEAVEDMLTKQETRSPKPDMNKRKEWKDQMTNLAAGLPGLDGIGKDNMDGWHDPEFVMDSGMAAVKTAKNLAVNFDNFLKASLDILGKKAFILFFDDIDVNAKKGIDVLETIRKYLVTRRTITIVSGDFELYLLAIRNKKWENFGKALIECEGKYLKKMQSFDNKVTELTTQYLLKVMQPSFRVHLTTLLQKINSETVSISILSEKKKGESIGIVDCYHQIFNVMGVRNTTQIEVYTTYMLGLPARTQIQFLLLIRKLNNTKDQNLEAISEVFIADLDEKDVDITLANQTPKYFCAIALKLLLKQHKLLDLYQLQPTTTDASLNGSMMALSMLFSRYSSKRDSFLIFDYFIKVAYIRNLLTLIPYKDLGNNRDATRLPDIEDLCEVGDVFNDGVLRDVSSAIQSYLLGALEKTGNIVAVSPFFNRLYSLQSVSKNTRNDSIDKVFNKSKKAECILAFMPCYNSTYAYKNESRVMYSIYVLLGAIGELVKRYEPNDGQKEMQSALNLLSQFRSYIIPDFRESKGGAPIEDGATNEIFGDREEETANETDDSDKVLAAMVYSWVDSKRDVVASPHLLGKMMTRFFYAMNNIASAYSREKSMKLGELFHYQVTAFMNAVLVEDVTEHGDINLLNINNTRLSDSIFIDNIRKVIRQDEQELRKLNLSRWLLSCPILHAYLRSNIYDKKHNDFKRNLMIFCGKFRDQNTFAYAISYDLDKVGVYSAKVNKPLARKTSKIPTKRKPIKR